MVLRFQSFAVEQRWFVVLLSGLFFPFFLTFFFFLYLIIFIVLRVQEFACSRSYGVNKTPKNHNAKLTKQKTIPLSSCASVTEALHTAKSSKRKSLRTAHATISAKQTNKNQTKQQPRTILSSTVRWRRPRLMQKQ